MAAYYERGDPWRPLWLVMWLLLVGVITRFVVAFDPETARALGFPPLSNLEYYIFSLIREHTSALYALLGSKFAASAASGHTEGGVLVPPDLSAPAVISTPCLNGSMTNGSDVSRDGPLGSKSTASAAGGHTEGGIAVLVPPDLSAPAVISTPCLNGSMTNGSDVSRDGLVFVSPDLSSPAVISTPCLNGSMTNGFHVARDGLAPTLQQMKKKKKNRADKLRKRAARAGGAAVTDATLDTMAPLVTPCSQPGAL